MVYNVVSNEVTNVVNNIINDEVTDEVTNEVTIKELVTLFKSGSKLYSPLFGWVEYVGVSKFDNTIVVKSIDKEGAIRVHQFDENGCFYSDYEGGECMLFPSDQYRKWDMYIEQYKEYRM